jgi:hypothetical protein
MYPKKSHDFLLSVPSSNASICSCVNDVRFLCNFLFNFIRSSTASSFSFNPSCGPNLLSSLPSDKSKSKTFDQSRCDDEADGGDRTFLFLLLSKNVK